MHSKAMKSGKTLRLRKGAWDSQEDTLLRTCIERYGEGKWHLVPQRAGLNRCRKSCRLRWLNYLRPTIKRGEFGEDEVDLMMRLHRLLGNRWSLIAGRLPGRTANDIKNFWNTNLQKKHATVSYQNDMVEMKELIQRKQDPNYDTCTGAVIKPLPRTLSKGTRLPCYNLNPNYHMNTHVPEEIMHDEIANINNTNNRFINKQPAPATPPLDQDGIVWWKNMLEEIEIHGQDEDSPEGLLMVTSSGLQNPERDQIWKTRDQSSTPTTEDTGLLEDYLGGWSDIWDLLKSDHM